MCPQVIACTQTHLCEITHDAGCDQAQWVIAQPREDGGLLNFVFLNRLQGLRARFGHGHFFAIPYLSAPTNSFSIDDASSSSATPGVVIHFYPIKNLLRLTIPAPMVSYGVI